MGRGPAADATTAERRLPERPRNAERQPALVVAFPAPAALPLPPDGMPVGRRWLGDHGIIDREMSTGHLMFSRAGRVLKVADAGSRNGSWLDAEPLSSGEPKPLIDGSVLRVGRTVLVYRETFVGPFEPSEPLGGLVGPYGLRQVARAVEALTAPPPSTVLLEGETGTGKELLASHVARVLARDRPYAAVNVASVAQGVFESQLFGHVAGAYSGAGKASRGLVAAHDRGCLFLDEIGALPIELQPKLLRLLENREILPVGAERPVAVDVLLIAATNRNLDELVAEGTFRQDLAARLGITRIRLPALRDRAEDLFPILQALAQRAGRELSAYEAEPEAVERLLLEPWPDNVRGLLALLGRLRELDPRGGLRLWGLDQVLGPAANIPGARLTAERVKAAIEASGGNEREAARRLGVSRGKLRRFLGKGGGTG
jgi:transcriptional regulator with AAA-type ATPase domain